MVSDMTRRLMLLRHAKSDWPDVSDHARPLAKRGRHDAPAVGRWLRAHGYLPDVVVCSTARRTRQTWELLAPELGASPLVTFDPRAYEASALTLLYLAQELPSRYRSALFVGHNPATSDLANSLAERSAASTAEGGAGEDSEADGGAGQGGAAPSAVIRFPTAAVAVLEFTGDWPSLTPGQARLVDFTAPADL